VFDIRTGRIDLPDWMFAAQIANPPDAFGYFAYTAFGIESSFGFRVGLPAFVTPAITALSLFVWTAVPLLLALWRFRRQDL
jgi:ABC-type transport system involved in multi-copper enzyme maturation permease subunit